MSHDINLVQWIVTGAPTVVASAGPSGCSLCWPELPPGTAAGRPGRPGRSAQSMGLGSRTESKPDDQGAMSDPLSNTVLRMKTDQDSSKQSQNPGLSTAG